MVMCTSNWMLLLVLHLWISNDEIGFKWSISLLDQFLSGVFWKLSTFHNFQCLFLIYLFAGEVFDSTFRAWWILRLLFWIKQIFLSVWFLLFNCSFLFPLLLLWYSLCVWFLQVFCRLLLCWCKQSLADLTLWKFSFKQTALYLEYIFFFSSNHNQIYLLLNH